MIEVFTKHLNYKVIHTFYYNKDSAGRFCIKKYKRQETNPHIPIQSTSQNCPKMHHFYLVLSIRPFSLQFFLAIATLKLTHELNFCTVLAMSIYYTITQRARHRYHRCATENYRNNLN